MILEKKSMIKFQKMTDSFGLPGFVENEVYFGREN